MLDLLSNCGFEKNFLITIAVSEDGSWSVVKPTLENMNKQGL